MDCGPVGDGGLGAVRFSEGGAGQGLATDAVGLEDLPRLAPGRGCVAAGPLRPRDACSRACLTPSGVGARGGI